MFTLASLVVNLGLVALAFWNADRFARWMGMQGLRGISKIVALLLAAIAVSLIRRGWNTASVTAVTTSSALDKTIGAGFSPVFITSNAIRKLKNCFYT